MDVKETQIETSNQESSENAQGLPDGVENLEITAGKVLYAARSQTGQSEKDIADQLRITVHYVKAIEQDAYEKLPGEIFAKGYIKAYATLLGEDPERVVRLYNEYCSTQQHQEKRKSESRANHRRKKSLPWIILAVAAFVIGFIGLWSYNKWLAGSDASLETSVQEASSRTGLAESNNDFSARSNQLRTVEEREGSERSNLLGASSSISLPNVDSQSEEPVFSSFAEAVNATQERVDPIPTTPRSQGTEIEERTSSPAAGSGLEETPLDAVTRNFFARANEAVSGTVEADESASNSQSDIRESITQGSNSTETTLTSANSINDRISISQNSEGRLITISGEGADTMRIRFSGESWVEIDDKDEVALYRNIRVSGDTLLVSGNAPFNVLLGNASIASIELNGEEIELASRIRADNTARVYVGR